MKKILLVALVLVSLSGCQRIKVFIGGSDEPRSEVEYSVKADLNQAGGAKISSKK